MDIALKLMPCLVCCDEDVALSKKGLIIGKGSHLMKYAFFLAGVLVSSSVFAAPTVYPTKPGVLASVKTNDLVKSSFIMDNHDDNLFYVLPPKSSYAYASGVTMANTNLGFCQQMHDLQLAGNAISQKLKNISEEQERLEPSIEKAGQALDRSRAKLDSFTRNDNIASQLATIDASIRNNSSRLSILYEKADSCREDVACDAIQDEIRSLQLANDKLEYTKQDLIEQNLTTANKIAEMTAQVSADQAVLDRINARYNALVTNKLNLMKTFTEAYAVYGKLEGGSAYLEYESKWDDQVALLKSLNPDKKFETVNTHDVKLNAAVFGSAATPSDVQPSAIIDSIVDGRVNNNENIMVATYPEQLTANIRLSLAGACPIAYPELFKFTGIDAGKVKLGISASYQFDSAFKTKISCDYDEKEMYSKILQSGSSGFLFWKKNWESISYDNIKSTTFACEWDQSTSSGLTFGQKRAFEVDALNYAIGRMLVKYGRAREVSPNLPSKPTSGLSEVGNSLWSLCGATNIFCAAGSWSLKAFDAVMGSGQATGTGTSHIESKIHLAWDETTVLPVLGQSNFNPDASPSGVASQQ